MHDKKENKDKYPIKITMDLEKRPWSSKSSPAKGPKRLCKFCVLAVILPIICLCVPLYMRFQALKPQIFTLSPSDMKLLNQVSINIDCHAFVKSHDDLIHYFVWKNESLQILLHGLGQ